MCNYFIILVVLVYLPINHIGEIEIKLEYRYLQFLLCSATCWFFSILAHIIMKKMPMQYIEFWVVKMYNIIVFFFIHFSYFWLKTKIERVQVRTALVKWL